MSEPTPYEKLGVNESASFEQIRDARDRLQKQDEGNEVLLAEIESAYDAILMERLKARQEGKIKVPEGIRFPERVATIPPTTNLPSLGKSAPNWLNNALDNPAPREIWISFAAAVFLILLGLAAPNAAASAWLPLALLASWFWLGRKENRVGRAFLLAISSFLIAVLLGLAIGQIPALGLYSARVASTVMLLVMWFAACFLR